MDDCTVVRCRSREECETHHRAHYARDDQRDQIITTMREQLDTLGSPWWKRLWFRFDGWPPWYIVAEHRAWRPWHWLSKR